MDKLWDEMQSEEKLAFLSCAVVHTGNSRFVAGDVVDHGFDHLRQHAMVRHAGDG